MVTDNTEANVTIRLTSANRSPQVIGSAPVSVLQKSTFFAARLEFNSESPIDLEEEEGLFSCSGMLKMLDFLKTGRVDYYTRMRVTQPEKFFLHVEDVQKEIVGIHEFKQLADFLCVDIEEVAGDLANYGEQLLTLVNIFVSEEVDEVVGEVSKLHIV